MLKASKPVNIGDHIPYIICCQHIDNSNGNATTTTTTNTTTTSSNHHNTVAQRAYHPDEVQRRSNELTIDYEWYLSTQILPPVSRLCEPIEGTSAAILSEKLGLDASKYVRSNQGGGDDDIDDSWGFTPQCQMEDNERSSSGNTMFACSHCGAMLAEMLPRDQMEIFRLLREHMANAVNGSAYNWIRPSLWSALFGKVNTANATTDNNNAVVASSSNLKSFI
eukprot:scaffold911_cov162-Ochromonas_danica.AAC.12